MLHQQIDLVTSLIPDLNCCIFFVPNQSDGNHIQISYQTDKSLVTKIYTLYQIDLVKGIKKYDTDLVRSTNVCIFHKIDRSGDLGPDSIRSPMSLVTV